jgi:hypothetical protein
MLAGIVLVILGAAALIHPELSMSAKREEIIQIIQIGPDKVQIDTRRIIDIPRIFSGMIVLAGGGLLLLGTKKGK